MSIKLSDYINDDNVKLDNRTIKELILRLQKRGDIMKTSEFIGHVEKLGFRVVDRLGAKAVLNGDDILALVDTKVAYKMDNTYASYNYMENKEKEVLFNLLVKYANTPLDERGKENKYFLSFKYNMDYINLNHLNGKVCFDSKDDGINNIQTLFTDKEIKELPKWVNEMIDQGHLIKEEVDDENK